MKLTWTARARTRLAELHDYIAQDSKPRALAMVERILDRAETLLVAGGAANHCLWRSVDLVVRSDASQGGISPADLHRHFVVSRDMHRIDRWIVIALQLFEFETRRPRHLGQILELPID
jgi:plasmid stabilization system protein ParE